MLAEELVTRTLIEYLLVSRLGTAANENLHLQVRGRGYIPGPVRVRQMKRLIIVARFLHVPRSASNPQEKADRYYVDFLQTKKERPFPGDEDDDFIDVADRELTLIQSSGVYRVVQIPLSI